MRNMESHPLFTDSELDRIVNCRNESAPALPAWKRSGSAVFDGGLYYKPVGNIELEKWWSALMSEPTTSPSPECQPMTGQEVILETIKSFDAHVDDWKTRMEASQYIRQFIRHSDDQHQINVAGIVEDFLYFLQNKGLVIRAGGAK